MNKNKPDLLEWLGLRREPDFSKARWLGALISGAIVLIAVILFGLALFAFLRAFWSSDPTGESVRNTGLTLAAMLGLPFLVWRSVVAQKQVDVAGEGLITDRINKAVQGLGSEKKVDRLGRIVTISHGEMEETETAIEWQETGPRYSENPDMISIGDWQVFSETQPNLEVRIGAIYALERIAQDSDRDHVQIMEILCAYIRQNAPAEIAQPFPEEWQEAFEAEWDDDEAKRPGVLEIRKWVANLKKPREDIQVALTVIGRRTVRQIALEGHADSDGAWDGYRLDLRGTHLQGADMAGMAFDNARLHRARMQGASLRKARMQGASLSEAQMQGADLYS